MFYYFLGTASAEKVCIADYSNLELCAEFDSRDIVVFLCVSAGSDRTCMAVPWAVSVQTDSKMDRLKSLHGAPDLQQNCTKEGFGAVMCGRLHCVSHLSNWPRSYP